MKQRTTLLTAATVAALCALLAACGGGGGGGGGGNIVPGTPVPSGQPSGNPSGNPSPTGSPSTSPPPTSSPSPEASGQLSIGAAALTAGANVVYTCGCSQQAGLTKIDSGGNATIFSTTTAIPASPSPTYTAVPGRNYLVIGYANSGHAQAWTMEFLGSTASHNLNLAGTSSGFTSTAPAAAASLYVYYDAGQKFMGSADQSFDHYNFNAIVNFAKELASPVNPQETKLVNDVSAAQASGTSMYPTVPVWNPDTTGGTQNATIVNDLKALAGTNAAVPTPCPTPGGTVSCTGAPAP